MLNKNGERELAYVVTVNAVKPIPGRDRVECAVVGGWTCMVPKGAFRAGDPGIYFEIDSQVPLDNPVFEFCAKYKGHIKTQKFKTPEGQFWSQGLLMPAADFGWFVAYTDKYNYIYDKEGNSYQSGTDSAFLTEKLGVTYYEVEDNKRKANVNPDAKINAALARHPKIAKKYGKFIKNHKWAKVIFLLLFGKKKDARNWPAEVKKTDEERIENRLFTLEARDLMWIATEKIDGSSSTYHLRRGNKFKKPEYFVCSRNVVFDTPERVKKNYYADTIGGNIWIEMSEKYDIKNKLQQLLDERPNADWVTLQGEIFGAGVQKRDYNMEGRDFRAFNLIYSDCGRVDTLTMKDILDKVGIPSVPIIAKTHLPITIERLRDYVHRQKSEIDGGMREGIVFRSLDGTDSFKCVDPEYLIKYHG